MLSEYNQKDTKYASIFVIKDFIEKKKLKGSDSIEKIFEDDKLISQLIKSQIDNLLTFHYSEKTILPHSMKTVN